MSLNMTFRMDCTISSTLKKGASNLIPIDDRGCSRFISLRLTWKINCESRLVSVTEVWASSFIWTRNHKSISLKACISPWWLHPFFGNIVNSTDTDYSTSIAGAFRGGRCERRRLGIHVPSKSTGTIDVNWLETGMLLRMCPFCWIIF